MYRHEGHGSILACLKEKGWATSLSAGEGSGSFSARSFFNVRVTLTDKGRYRPHSRLHLEGSCHCKASLAIATSRGEGGVLT